MACNEVYTPKPRSFYRIDLPEKAYQVFNEKTYPFRYEYPVYAQIIPFNQEGEKYWTNVIFPDFNAQINLSYLEIHNNLKEYIADATMFVNKHQQKAVGIFEREYVYPEGRVYGVIYDIKGSGVASTCQFYLTDSVHHFVRGALYFMETPNNDSLSPIIRFLREDIENLIRTVEWKR
ncbi:gliding motility lipoprotein GldD [Bacteroidia bacterium]|nr:gliding motility lipoprotein GldD [Bacteroidia bacterium]